MLNTENASTSDICKVIGQLFHESASRTFGVKKRGSKTGRAKK